MIFNIDTETSGMGNPIPRVTVIDGEYEMITNGNDWEIKIQYGRGIRFDYLGSAKYGIDIFLVGGGGASWGAVEKVNKGLYSHHAAVGGSGGYTSTIYNFKPKLDQDYVINIGTGGISKYKWGGGFTEVYLGMHYAIVAGDTTFTIPKPLSDSVKIVTGKKDEAGYNGMDVEEARNGYIVRASGGGYGFCVQNPHYESTDGSVSVRYDLVRLQEGGSGGSWAQANTLASERGVNGMDGEQETEYLSFYYPPNRKYTDGSFNTAKGQGSTTIAYGDGHSLFGSFPYSPGGGTSQNYYLDENGIKHDIPGSGGSANWDWVGSDAGAYAAYSNDAIEYSQRAENSPLREGMDYKSGKDGVILIRPHKNFVQPEFIYTGRWSYEGENGKENHWKIKFLTSGTFTLLSSPVSMYDLFLVGGGGAGGKYDANLGTGSGGGGGYTKTIKNLPLEIGKPYQIFIGEGGGVVREDKTVLSTDGETTQFLYSPEIVYEAAGGRAGSPGAPGGDGGSGGGAPGVTKQGSLFKGVNAGDGGEDGSDGEKSGNSTETVGIGGKGQGTTTRAFEDPTEEIYAYGGSGGGGQDPSHPDILWDGGASRHRFYSKGGVSAHSMGLKGKKNTGDGGGGGSNGLNEGDNARGGGQGGSGIVIIRDARTI